MPPNDRRRDLRARVSLPTFVIRKGVGDAVQMVDASYRGLFLRMAEPPPERYLVQLRICLPSRDIVVHAVVVRVADDTGPIQGVGLRFFALNGHDRADWEAFVAGALQARGLRAA